MEIWAIIPVKRLDHAKSRLASLLDPNERAQLALSMFRDVLDTLANVKGLAGVLVVTNDPQASAVAGREGATILPDPHESGTNQAVKLGLAWLQQKNVASAIVIPSDIPFATAAEINTVIMEIASCDVVIVPALRDKGTNILAIRHPGAIEVAFGENSFDRHIDAARSAGFEPCVLNLNGAGHDIDVSSDLFFDEGDGPAVRTRTLVKWLRRHRPADTKFFSKEICSHE